MRFAPPAPATRHALAERAHGATGPIPVRRSIAVVAVVGGALSAVGAGVAAAVPAPHGADTGTTAVGLTAGRTDTPAAAGTAATPASRGPAVLDTGTMARVVRNAHAEGQKLVDRGPAATGTPSATRSAAASPATRAPATRAPAAQAPAAQPPSPQAAAPQAAAPQAAATTSATAPDAAVAAPAGGGRTASQFPGELIEPEDWYLTLPTGKEGNPDTIDGSKLATFHNQFFALNPERDGIVFSAGAGGVTTKNSHYPRSELREMNGDAKAAWSNTSGKHVIDVREAFTKLPGAKPEVVGVQIHDGEDDVLQIRLEGKTLSVQSNDGRDQTVLDPDYKLGTPFDVRIVAADGKVDVFYDGAKKATLPLSGSGWYWKVGAYVQSNTTKGDGAGSTGEVTVYRAAVTHE